MHQFLKWYIDNIWTTFEGAKDHISYAFDESWLVEDMFHMQVICLTIDSIGWKQGATCSYLAKRALFTTLEFVSKNNLH